MRSICYNIICQVNSTVSVYHNMYISSSVYNVNVSFSFVIMSANADVTCSKRIPYYTYYTCQLRPYVIEIDRLETCMCFKWVSYIPRPRPKIQALNQALSQGSQVTCITCIIRTGRGVSHPTGTLQWNPLSAAQPISQVHSKYRCCLLY